MLFDTTVTLCIILNTAFLAVEHHGMSDDLKHVLDIGNKAKFYTETYSYILEIHLDELILKLHYIVLQHNNNFHFTSFRSLRHSSLRKQF